MRFTIENDLFKARTHKYVRRTGTPGSYRYWYELPDGRLVADPEKQEMGKLDHIKRLIAARLAGKHDQDNSIIAREVGSTAAKVDSAKRNMKRGGRNIGGRTYGHGHDYTEAHLDEAMLHHTRLEREETESAPAATSEPESSTSQPETPTETRTRGGSLYGPNVLSKIEGQDREKLIAAGFNLGRTQGEKSHMSNGHMVHFTIKLRDDGKWELSAIPRNLDGPLSPFNDDFSSPKKAIEKVGQLITSYLAESEPQAEPETPAQAEPAPEESGLTDEQKRLIEKLKAAGIDLTPQPEPVAELPVPTIAPQARAKEAVQRAARIRESAPTGPNAEAIHAVVPELAEADAAINEMIAAQARGENPYLQRAKDIFHNIQGDLKPERKDIIRHLMSAINVSKDHMTGKIDEAMLLSAYKEISGRNVRGLQGVAEEFEKGTFMSLNEVLGNAPVDPEIERMKRGFAAKQFARMKPFLKSSWTQANPSAPPPFPTYGDLKSWTEHGSKPSWAGTTRMAVPKEVHDAAHQVGGKPKHPPAWMPIHLAPLWKYVMAKSTDDSAYQARGVGISSGNGPTGHNIDMGNQAGFQEGMVVNAIRKYVQMRGGVSQLVDIPSSKLSEVNLTHSDIFKSDDADLSDRAIKKLITHKIIDPVAMVPFMNEELSLSKKTKKSFSLVVDATIGALDFRPEIVIKSELINKIKALKQKRLS